jgi:hypothetical protein
MRYGQIVADWTRSAQALSARFASHAKRLAARNAGDELTEESFGQLSAEA